MLSFFPQGVLDEILNLIESVFEGFPSYSQRDPKGPNERKIMKYNVKAKINSKMTESF